jgi:gluconate 2-dehydrogenase gamma chain
MHNADSENDSKVVASRRAFIVSAAGVAVLMPVPAALGAPGPVSVAPASAAQRGKPTAQTTGYTQLGPEEATFVEALVNVMCPADSLTPNGTDCGLAIYIDRQLAGDFGKGGRLYSHGPWIAGKPQQGYQLPLKPAEFFIAGIAAARGASQARYGKPFEQLSAVDAGAFLADIAAGKVTETRVSLADWFTQLVYPLFQQACFADPVYGGNRDKVFWKMIGYPGLPALHARNMVQFRGKPFPGARAPQSILDFT